MPATAHNVEDASRQPVTGRDAVQPRLGFLGLGWIGQHRLAAASSSGCVEIAAVADMDVAAIQAARQWAPDAAVCNSFEMLLEQDLDGLVIATPNALHDEQVRRGLERGLAVFCQKPLARTAEETRRIVQQAQSADRLLGVDLSYRFIAGVSRMRELVQGGELGTVYAVELVFHNAYGPDKAWFYDVNLSGGGCLIDLGTHLVDLALWFFEDRPVINLRKQLYRQGNPLRQPTADVEDFAWAEWECEHGPAVRLACSWGISAGCDAVIEAVCYGTEGSVALRNVQGSFYDFRVEHFRGRERTTLAEPPDAWGGRALVEWSRRLAGDCGFDPAAKHLVDVAALLDRIYDR